MKIAAIVCLTLGIGVLLQVFMPIVSFKFWELEFIKETLPLATPLPSTQVLGVSIKDTNDNFPAIVSSLNRDSKPNFDKFYLTVPSLKVENVEVFVDSNDLSRGLVHLPGSALPGEKGNVFISGHSSLPIIFNKDTKTIFKSLPGVKEGDTINLTVGGSQFRYQVIDIKIIDPKDLSVVLPPDNMGRFISLMTCVPPGLNTKRLVVLGKLQ